MNKAKYNEMIVLLKAINEWWQHGDAPLSPHCIALYNRNGGEPDKTLREQVSEILSQKD